MRKVIHDPTAAYLRYFEGRYSTEETSADVTTNTKPKVKEKAKENSHPKRNKKTSENR